MLVGTSRTKCSAKSASTSRMWPSSRASRGWMSTGGLSRRRREYSSLADGCCWRLDTPSKEKYAGCSGRSGLCYAQCLTCRAFRASWSRNELLRPSSLKRSPSKKKNNLEGEINEALSVRNIPIKHGSLARASSHASGAIATQSDKSDRNGAHSTRESDSGGDAGAADSVQAAG